MRVLITGAFGWTAASIVQTIKQAGHHAIAFDLPTACCEAQIRKLFDQTFLGNVATLNEVERAVQASDAIIHLAVAVGKRAYRNSDLPFAVNVKGTYNVFEAARRHSIEKIVLMSSAAVHLPLEAGEKMSALSDWKSSPGDDHLYDLSKRLQEEIARDFCQTHRMNVVTLRAGHIVDGRQEVDPHGQPLSQVTYCRGGWVCRYDLARACVKALALESNGYEAFHVIGSWPARAHFDVARTENELELVCEIQFERYT